VLQPIALVAQHLHEMTESTEAAAAAAAWDDGDGDDKAEVFAAVWDGVLAIKAEQRGGESRGSDGTCSAAELLQRDEGEGEPGSRLPTKRLLKLLSQALGKKEAGKIARNRAEAVAL